jgi:hypothetical protein
MQKPSEEEEKYFHQEELRQLEDLRGEIHADEDTKKRWAEIAEAVGSKELAIGRALEQLGFNAQTAPVLYFMPLLEVAWADGKLSYEESTKIVEMARMKGIRATSEAFELLSSLSLRRPSDQFFSGTNQVIRALLQALPAEEREGEINSLAQLAILVAKASRGFFGFGKAVTDDERVAIEQMVKELGLQDSSKTHELLQNS